MPDEARRQDSPIATTVGVFGANGFIGRALVAALLRAQRRVIAFGRAFPVNYHDIVGGPVETRTLDLSDALSAHAMIQDIDQVVQLINSSSPALGNTRVVDDITANVLPHVSFIESCRLSGVRRFVFVSSGGTVYGEPRFLPINEQHPTQPIVSYGLTKLVTEQYIQMLTRGAGMDHVILRVSNPFGPGQTLRKGQGLIASILQRYGDGLPITIYGDGRSQRDYLYIDDLSEGIIAALDAPPIREIVNIGTGVGRSILDIVAAMEIALGVRLELDFKPGRTTDARSNILDCGKATQVLGWSASTPFEDAIRQTVAARDKESFAAR